MAVGIPRPEPGAGTCDYCKWAEWPISPTSGRITTTSPGKCRYVIPWPPVPLALTHQQDVKACLDFRAPIRFYYESKPCPVRELVPVAGRNRPYKNGDNFKRK